ncbi:hypothetical protein BDA96_08G093100 [Sorghum bicolor]|uniref:Uncharacterized protein n=2 Tax=Sorghum bicolor TaxID=4558 RepID=A0A921U7P4_SORBI|nr:hypothetical protein BDA96_08G093100 [Sorghum bicolor]OQU78996.1 hypothetical protein SORBI_3008G086401 [Sorghum bicolor]
MVNQPDPFTYAPPPQSSELATTSVAPPGSPELAHTLPPRALFEARAVPPGISSTPAPPPWRPPGRPRRRPHRPPRRPRCRPRRPPRRPHRRPRALPGARAATPGPPRRSRRAPMDLRMPPSPLSPRASRGYTPQGPLQHPCCHQRTRTSRTNAAYMTRCPLSPNLPFRSALPISNQIC